MATDTSASLLREFVEKYEADISGQNGNSFVHDIYVRARNLYEAEDAAAYEQQRANRQELLEQRARQR